MQNKAKPETNVVKSLFNRQVGVSTQPTFVNTLTRYAESRASKPSGNKACELSGQTRSTFLTVYSPDCTKIASLHGDHTVRITDIASWKCTHILTGHPRTPWCAAFHPSCNTILATGCLSGEVRIWDLHGVGSEVWRAGPHMHTIASLTFHPTDHVLVIATSNELHFWDWSQPEPFTSCKTNSLAEKVRWVKFSPLGHYLYTGIQNLSELETEELYSLGSHDNLDGRRRSLRHRYSELMRVYRRERALLRHGNNSLNVNSSDSDSDQPTSPPDAREGLEVARDYATFITDRIRRSSTRRTWFQPSTTMSHSGLPSYYSRSISQQRSLHDFPSYSPSGVSQQVPREVSHDVESSENNITVTIRNTHSLGNTPVSRTGASPSSQISTVNVPNSASSLPQVEDTNTSAATVRVQQTTSDNEYRPSSPNRYLSMRRDSVTRQMSDSNEGNVQSVIPTVRGNVHSGESSNTSLQSSVGTHGVSSSYPQQESILRSQLWSVQNELSYSSVVNNPTCENCGDHVQCEDNPASSRASRCTCRLSQRNETRSSNITGSSSSISNTVVSTAGAPRLRFHDRPEAPFPETSLGELHSVPSSSSLGSVVNFNSIFDTEERNQEGDTGVHSSAMSNAGQDSNTQEVSIIEPSLLSSDERPIQRIEIDSTADSQDPETMSIDEMLERQVSEINENNFRFEEERRIEAGMRQLQEQRERWERERWQNARESLAARRNALEDLRQRWRNLRQRMYLSREGNRGTLLERNIRNDPEVERLERRALRVQRMRIDCMRRQMQQREREQSWHTLQRGHLHPHYSSSIFDDTINRPSDALQSTINRAIAGAFNANGEAAVASNITNVTYRIQRWDFRNYAIPDISNREDNIIVPNCKLHNDANCEVSQDGRLLATFVPSHQGFPDDTVLGIFSLEARTLGQCLYTKKFGPNAVSVSISPKNQYVLVGLAAKRLSWVFTSRQMIGQVFRLHKVNAGENSTQHVTDLHHPLEQDMRNHVSVNTAKWLPSLGAGIVYGTNRGDMHICQPGLNEPEEKASEANAERTARSSGRGNLMQFLGMNIPRTMSASTQTVISGVRRGEQVEHQINDSDTD